MKIKIGLIILLLVLLLIFGKTSYPATAQSTGNTPLQSETGILSVVIEDDFNNKKAAERYYITSDTTGRVTELVYQGVLDVPSGSKIRVSGINTSTGQIRISLEENIGSIEIIQRSSPGRLQVSGQKNVIVILANFSNRQVSNPTSAQVNSILDSQLSPYMAEMSYGKATFNYDVIPYWVTGTAGVTCDPNIIVNNAIRAADSIVNFNNYQYILVVFPNSSPNCSYGGFGYYPPGFTFSSGEGRKTIPVSAIPDNYFISSGKNVGAHELGHNMGLKHANGLECGQVSISNGCIFNIGNQSFNSSVEYGDWFDIMGGGGYSYSSHYGAFNKEFLQWLNNSNVQYVYNSGRYNITHLEQGSGAKQSLKIPMLGTNYYYNVENRIKYGYDSQLPTNAVSGALIKVISNTLAGYTAGYSYFIDSTPNSKSASDFNDGGWGLGSTFDDPTRGIRIKPVSKTNNVLAVDVNFYGPNLVSPAAGAKISAVRPTLDWSDLTYRGTYTLQVARDSAFTNLILQTNLTPSQYTFQSDLPKGVNIYWRVRANYAFGSSDWSQTNSFSIANSIDSVSASGSTISVNFSDSQTTVDDWIGIYNTNSVTISDYISWKWLNNSTSKPQTPVRSGSVTFSGMTSGTYLIKHIRQGNVVSANELKLTSGINPLGNVSSSGGNVTVSFNSPGAKKNDWIGIYRTSSSPEAEWIDWMYLNNSKTQPVAVVKSGSVKLSNLYSGSYELRYVNQGTILGRKSVTVSSSANAVSAVSSAGTNSVNASYRITQAQTNDWIGIYNRSGSLLDWKYLNNTRTLPQSVSNSGAVTLTNPGITAGQVYVVKYVRPQNNELGAWVFLK